MVEAITTGSAIASVHEQLHRALTQLDRAGEHVAAAHLLAAIDSLEDRLKKAHAGPVDSTSERPLEVITKALISRYGDHAETVARDQLASARGDAMLTWAHIVRHIEEEHDRQKMMRLLSGHGCGQEGRSDSQARIPDPCGLFRKATAKLHIVCRAPHIRFPSGTRETARGNMGAARATNRHSRFPLTALHGDGNRSPSIDRL